MTKQETTVIPVIPFTGKIYDFDSIIDKDCDFKGLTVAEALEQDQKSVWKLIKNGIIVDFSDDVLNKTNITKHAHDYTVEHVFVDRVIKKSNRVYKKDTESVENIVKSLNILDSGNIKQFYPEEMTDCLSTSEMTEIEIENE